MTIDNSVGNRISMLRTLLILLIVLLHTGGPTIEELDYSSPIEINRFIFQDIMGRLGVPTLTVISGYLLFFAKLDLAPLKLYSKKFKTLAIPFLFFNVLYFVIQYGIEYFTGFAPLYFLVDKPAEKLINFAFSYNGMPLNDALHFLRDMMVLVVLAPLFGIILRKHALLGFIVISVVFLNNLDHTLVARDTMAVLFYLGGWIATSNFDLKKFDYLGKYSLILLIGVCFITLYFRIYDYTYIYLAAPFAVWPASALLVDTKIGEWLISKSKYSFFLFLAHTPILRVLHLFNLKFFSGEPSLMFVGLAFFTVVATVFIIYNISVKYITNTFFYLTGGRTEKNPSKSKEVIFLSPTLNK